MMKKYSLIFLLALPALAHAQLSAPTADATIATTSLTGKPESVHVFFDNKPIRLTAAASDTSEFTWFKLNVADTTLDLVRRDDSLLVSTLHDIAEGGYQVVVLNLKDLAAPVDTFTTWVFRDTFSVTGITHVNTCAALELTFQSVPYFYSSYKMYNFNDFLYTDAHAGEVIFLGNENSEVRWTANRDIHEGVDHPDDSWKSVKRNTLLYIDNPPPMKEATYSVEVKDIFGKSSSYTMPHPVADTAVYAKMTAKEIVGGQETPLDDLSSDTPLTDKEALYEIRFSHEKSLNAQKYYWKGFGEASNSFTRNAVMWNDSTTNQLQWITPHMPYKGHLVDGYTPGSYTVQLLVLSTRSGCTAGATLTMVVDPSKFSAESIPNAFTPNGDNTNDIFKFVEGQTPKSMEYIKIYVLSRSGALVYRYEGRVDAWEGWNGKILNTGSDVADGVYYYVISGEGWDGVKYDTSVYKGVLHVFR